MEGLDSVILIGGASISSEAIARCVRNGVRVSSLTRAGRIRFTAGGPAGGNVHLRIAQLRTADADAAIDLARLLVAGKIRNSRQLVRQWANSAQHHEASVLDRAIDGIDTALLRLSGSPTADHIRGAEGEAARWHFKALGAHVSLAGGPFVMERRSRRPPADPLNALLSFGYALLTNELIGACEAVGLDPQIGFLHRPRSGRPALALDLIEELRAPLVDRLVAALVRRRQLREEHFVETPGGGWYLTDTGREVYLSAIERSKDRQVHHPLLQRDVEVWALPTIQATVMARFLRDDLPTYVPWQGR